MDNDVVKTGKVTVEYQIHKYDNYGGEGIHSYDWTLSSGAESYDLFDSIEEAVIDIERRFL